MAIARSLCSTTPSHSHSHSLPTTLNHPNKFGLNLVSNEALLLASAAEALALARAAAQSAREAVIIADANNTDSFTKRRNKRKTRFKEVDDKDDDEDVRLSNKIGYLSPREEADCCHILKVNP